MEATKELKYFILIVFILAFVWFFTGGSLRPSSKSGWFLSNPTLNLIPTGGISGKTGQTSSKQISSAKSIQNSSSQSSISPDFATLKTTGARETDPDQEYVEIAADRKNKNPIKITGWKLKGKIGLDVALGKGASYIYSDIANQPQGDVYLNPGETAVVVTGKSPIGTSFKLNKCAGYFEQFNVFTPDLNAQCPLLRNEKLPSNLNDICLDYIDRISSCQTIVSIPYKYSFGLSSSCQDFITQNANYKTCLNNHKDDADFYLPEWRVYMERGEEMWKKSRETITLYDDKNNIIDSRSY